MLEPADLFRVQPVGETRAAPDSKPRGLHSMSLEGVGELSRRSAELLIDYFPSKPSIAAKPGSVRGRRSRCGEADPRRFLETCPFGLRERVAPVQLRIDLRGGRLRLGGFSRTLARARVPKPRVR